MKKTRGKGTANKWNETSVLAEMKKYSSRSEFQRASVAAYRFARLNGLLNTYFNMKRIGKPRKWTRDSVIREALRFQTRSEFSKGNPSAYNAAKKSKLIDELFGHVRNQWTTETIRKELMKYSSRTDFYRHSGSAYSICLQRFKPLMDELLPATSDRNGCDNDTIYIWRAVGQFFNGNPVYKIGVTSHRLGMIRIKQVATEAEFDYELICCEKVVGKATNVERKLHLLGEDPKYTDLNGKTEFRALTDSALYAAISIVCGSL